MNTKTIEFHKLTPTNDIDIGIYTEAINYAFKNDDITNVAISGPYSSGKSSIIESYKKVNSNKKFRHISLAHFCSVEKKCSEESSNDNKSLEPRLEAKILNQLVHQIPANKIPQTNFKIKRDNSCCKSILYSFMILLFISSIFYQVKYTSIFDYVNLLSNKDVKDCLLFCIMNYSVISFMFIVSFSFYVLYKIIRERKYRIFLRRINFQGNEIEISDDHSNSYFDKYLNDVLYIFKNTGADAIVFEDMDRFDSNNIFERLREINILINSGTKSKLRFIYLIRDDIFIAKDRTKFFDFIIPVIPIVDSSNSYEQIVRCIKEMELDESNGIGFDDSFLRKLSLYIDDMRVIKNVINEFKVYFIRLRDSNDIKLDCDKMLAMIVYKNLFPKDFCELQLNEGFVFQIFEQKIKYISSKITELKNKIINLEKDIKSIENEHLESMDELNFLNSYGRAKNYIIRKDYLEKGLKIAKKEKNEELSKYNEELAKINSQRLKNIMTTGMIESILDVKYTDPIGRLNEYKEIKGDKYFGLLKVLLLDGKIDETYSDYMTYFYSGSLSTGDKRYIRSILEQSGKDYEYNLDNPPRIMQHSLINESVFYNKEVLNFDLFSYLLNSNSKNEILYKKYITILVEQLIKNKEYEFIAKYYERKTNTKDFITFIGQFWPELFSDAQDADNPLHSHLLQFSVDVIAYSTEDNFNKININNCLTDYISMNSAYLAIDESYDVNKIVSAFIELKIKFESIEYNGSNQKLFDLVYEHSLYILNFNNIKLMLVIYYKASDDDIIHKNYSAVLLQDSSPLIRYVNENIDEYMGIVFDNCEDIISDDENAVRLILGNEKISNDNKMKYIDFLKTILSDISRVDNVFWDKLLEHKLIQQNINNIVNYFKVYELNKQLINFINTMPKSVDFAQLKEYDESIRKELWGAFKACNELSTDAYIKIMLNLKFHTDNLNINNLDDEKISALIKHNLISMSENNLILLRQNYSNQVLGFIKYGKNIDKYITLVENSTLYNIDEVREILSWDIENIKKINLLKMTAFPISVTTGIKYDEEVNKYILQHNFNKDDILELVKKYSTYGDEMQAAIYDVVVEHILTIVSEKLEDIDLHLLSRLYGNENIDASYRTKLFLNNIARYKGTLKKVIAEFTDSDLGPIFTNKKIPKVSKSTINQLLLDVLMSKEVIANYTESDEGDAYIVEKKK